MLLCLLYQFYSLLNKATHEKAWADPNGEAYEGGCEQEARVGCACGVGVCCEHTDLVQRLRIWICSSLRPFVGAAAPHAGLL